MTKLQRTYTRERTVPSINRLENRTPQAKEGHWTPSTLHTKLTKPHNFPLKMDILPAVSHTQETSPHFFLIFSSHGGPSQLVLRKMSSSQCERSPKLSQGQTPVGPEETRLLSAVHRAKTAGRTDRHCPGKRGGLVALWLLTVKCRLHLPTVQWRPRSLLAVLLK